MKFNAKDELQKRFGGQVLWGKPQVIPKEYMPDVGTIGYADYGAATALYKSISKDMEGLENLSDEEIQRKIVEKLRQQIYQGLLDSGYEDAVSDESGNPPPDIVGEGAVLNRLLNTDVMVPGKMYRVDVNGVSEV